MIALDVLVYVDALLSVMVATIHSLSTRLRASIALAGLDFQTLDNLAGLTSGHTGQIARGSNARPTGETLVALAIVLGTSVEWLVRGRGAAPTPKRAREAVAEARARVVSGVGGHRAGNVSSPTRSRKAGSVRRSA